MSRSLCIRCYFPLVLLFAIASATRAQDIRAYAEGELPKDRRLESMKDLDGYFPFEVPASVSEWKSRKERLRKQVLLATGLWPELPQRTPMNPVVHGRVQRDGFTVEKVYFESIPNHFVTGLLFRPDDGKSGKRPAVLCPHGHGGRMQDYGADKMPELLASGAEKFAESGRFPKLARCVQLARMGCVVFIFDMLGYEDSQQISYDLAHRFKTQRPEMENSESWGFFSCQAESNLQSIVGVQTWNSIRCLDFLQQLPDVDASRIAVTGGSGGGTQTILLCAIDDRPIAAFPNGMVS
ncbi:MAG: alpha/beta hydrolase family protein, partial [Planctomycetota bacterium]